MSGVVWTNHKVPSSVEETVDSLVSAVFERYKDQQCDDIWQSKPRPKPRRENQAAARRSAINIVVLAEVEQVWHETQVNTFVFNINRELSYFSKHASPRSTTLPTHTSLSSIHSLLSQPLPNASER